MGKKCIFLTNNATKLPADYGTKMGNMGYRNVKNEFIYTSAASAGKYVAQTYKNVRKAFVIGESSLRLSLEAQGIEVIGADQHILPPDVIVDEAAFDNYELDPDVGVVVFGLDFSFTHQKLLLASRYV